MRTKLRYSIRLRLYGEDAFFGPGVQELLERVEQTGSLQMAAAEMAMSYSKAWKMIRRAEAELGFALLARQAGGAGGGGSRLTEDGKVFLARYAAFERQVGAAADELFAAYFGDTAPLTAPHERGTTNATD